MTAPASGQSGPFPALPAHAGIGLKPQHYEAVLDAQAQPGRPAWVEVHPQNYFCDGGPPHRWLAVVVAVAALAVAAQLFRAGARGYAIAVEAAVGAQFLLGVLTLLHSVPVALGVAHQTGAVVLLVVTVAAAHWSLGGARRLVTP